MTIHLRHYQAPWLDAIRSSFAAGARSVLGVMPTGAGKTVSFCEMVRLSSAMGNRVAVLVHRDNLLGQASRALDAAGIGHGIIAPGHTPTSNLVQVASVHSLARRLASSTSHPARHQFDFLIIDEGHHATASTWVKIIAANPTALVLGVTATPCRTDGQGLDHIFESLVLGPSIQDLIDDGYLVDARVYAPANLVNLSKVHTRAGDYDRGELANAMDTPSITGDAVEHYRRLCPGAPAVTFCVSIQHAQDVAEDFSRAGFRSRAIHGKQPAAEIRRALEDLSAGRLDVLSSCDLISEGFDCPGIVAAILLRPTQSEALYIQQVGRALRPVYPAASPLSTREDRLAAIAASPKPRAIILDHSGNCFKHGMPSDPRDWTLEGKKKRRRGDQGPPVPVRQCRSCFACHRPAPSCPFCGFVYPLEVREVETKAGVLAEVDAAALRKARALKGRVRAAKTLEEFHAIAKDYGYRPAWASIKFQIVEQYRNRGKGA